ncbi:MAG: dipeptidase [Acidobacteriota bacterium]
MPRERRPPTIFREVMMKRPDATGRGLAAAAPLLIGGVLACAPPPGEPAVRVPRVHFDSIVVDTHVDAPYQLQTTRRDLGERGATPHFDIPRAREGGVGAAFFAVYVRAYYAEVGGAARQALDLIDLIDRVVRAHPDELMPAVSAAGIRRARRAGRIAILMGIEGGHAIEDSLGALRAFHRLGVRYMTLTHVNSNNWADSSGRFYLPDFVPGDARIHGGLNDFGREVVREMNRLGMMVDISHVSEETVDDVLETSRAPVFASHSSCRALSDHPRNLTDDQIRRIAAGGGVVMINIGSYFLDQAVVDAWAAAVRELRPEYDAIVRDHAGDPVARDEAIEHLLDRIPRARAPWTRAVDHIEHVIEVAGPDAVGLGTDFDGIKDPPDGLEDVSKLPRISEELLRRGHSEEVVRKVLGENFLRFFARVEEVARSLAGEPPRTATPPAEDEPREEEDPGGR